MEKQPVTTLEALCLSVSYTHLDVYKRQYANIRLPRRATKGSAGYDFFAPESFTLVPHETILIPTGIRVMIEDGWMLQLYPRSGLGFRHRLQLDNTVGVIDSDYFRCV